MELKLKKPIPEGNGNVVTLSLNLSAARKHKVAVKVFGFIQRQAEKGQDRETKAVEDKKAEKISIEEQISGASKALCVNEEYSGAEGDELSEREKIILQNVTGKTSSNIPHPFKKEWFGELDDADFTNLCQEVDTYFLEPSMKRLLSEQN